ncbi:helicase-related protein [Methylocapsa aurea]|uniref:helicase-related protein n=1 Tax=Methylocapsa aurea TaxID=663610 RepID=UPI00056A1A43|nr:helicase-related protein [Methylocapsa aurea]
MNISFPAAKPHPHQRARGVSLLLGPTNTGKTHYAIERMLSHSSGMIGLPLRLLAREVYNRAVEKVGAAAVALVTGEEKIKPKAPRYWISTVEAMPRDLDLAFVAVDEIQLAADLDRGHVFTNRILNRRGREETLLIGAATMQRPLQELLPGARILTRPRLSKLSFAGDKKMTRLPRRSAIVAFSAEEVYAIAEWIRRQRGGAAVVLGALSPRTRNAQVEMFQNGDVDYIIATDAIGMGLNLDVDHIAFAADRKYDGWQHRRLHPAEFGQIAGRAGRHLRDGTFGTTGRCLPFDAELVEALEEHRFESVRMLQWRNADLDFSSLRDLIASLDVSPKEPGLTRAPLAEDQMVLDIASRDEKVVREAKTRADIARLWECCQIPDYRKLSPTAHADLVLSVFGFVVRAGHIPNDWLARHVGALDRVDGDLDALSARIAQVRTWTFIANRSDWLLDPEHWQGVTRQVEDTLSDALHERLAQRFVDRRTSVLMRRLRENAMLEAEVTTSGDVMVEGQHVGQLNGFRFTADPLALGEAAKALNAAAQKALASEIEGRATRVHEAVDEAFVLANDGIIRWLGEPVGKIAPGAHVLEPRVCVLADEQLSGPMLEMVQRRLDLWLAQHVKKLLGPLKDLETGEGLEGIARGIAFHVAESLGILERARVADDVKNLPQEARAALRKFGIRFGAYHLYLPNLVKPAPRALAAQLWALKNGGVDEVKGLDDVPHLAASGRTSFVADKDVQKGFYRAAGFRICGDRAVRVDILERLADLIRPAVAYRPGVTPGDPPTGAADADGFVVSVAMTSLAGCSGESFASILRSLGYVLERRKGPAITTPLLPMAPTEPLALRESPPVETSELAAEGAPQAEAQFDAQIEVQVEVQVEVHAQEPVIEAAGMEAEAPLGEVLLGDVLAARPGSCAEEAPPTVAEDLPEAAAAHAPNAPIEDMAQAKGEAPEPADAAAPADAPGEAATDASSVAATESEQDGAVADFGAVEDAAASDPVEPALIEVWRPHRQHHHARRPEPRAAKKPERRENAPIAADAEAAAAAPDQSAQPGPPRERRRTERSGDRGRAGAESRSAGPGGASSEGRQNGHKDGRPPNRGPAKGRFEGQRDRREGGGPSRGAEDRRHGHGHGPGAQFGANEKRSSERAPDPNSPFAKLLVLKARLEEKNRPDS